MTWCTGVPIKKPYIKHGMMTHHDDAVDSAVASGSNLLFNGTLLTSTSTQLYPGLRYSCLQALPMLASHSSFADGLNAEVTFRSGALCAVLWGIHNDR